MALADKKIETGKHKITDVSKLAAISASFAEGKHIDLQVFPGEAALLFKIQKLEEDIDELRRYVTNEATGSAIDFGTGLANATGIKLPSTSPGSGRLFKDKSGFVKLG
tara:strand:- start:578 stop:901 length:324 start_codon:yes stop_codon:yes gene_type:complete